MITRQSLILLFALAFALFIVGLPFLDQTFAGYPLMHWADVLDIATPLVLMPLYWVLFTNSGRVYRPLPLALAFAVLAALWAEGQGMHLSANSISNLLGAGTTEVHTLIHFYDEVLSHYLWHLGIITHVDPASRGAVRRSRPLHQPQAGQSSSQPPCCMDSPTSP